MAEEVWKGVYPQVFGRSKQLSLNKFFDPSTPSMRKGCNGEKNRKKRKRLMIIVATTSMPAVDRQPPERRPLELRTPVPILTIRKFNKQLSGDRYNCCYCIKSKVKFLFYLKQTTLALYCFLETESSHSSLQVLIV